MARVRETSRATRPNSPVRSMIDIHTRDADTPLSDARQTAGAALATWFARSPPHERPNVVMCSPFVRSQQTCAGVAEAIGHDMDEILVDERLREKEFGILDRYTRHGHPGRSFRNWPRSARWSASSTSARPVARAGATSSFGCAAWCRCCDATTCTTAC